MNKITHDRLEQKLLIYVSKIINEEITNSNIHNPTVVDVKLSNDGSHLNVYVTFTNSSLKGIEALNNAKSFIRKSLTGYWDKRRVPDIHFFLDDVSERVDRLENIFKNIENSK